MITNAAGGTWNSVYHALQFGRRGLRGRSSIATILAKHRGLRDIRNPPRLTDKQILAWADAYYERAGEWPSHQSGPIAESPGERWSWVAHSMMRGNRGMRARYSLVRLLAEKRGRYDRLHPPRLDLRQILRWADAHHQRTGDWPSSRTGGIPGTPHDTWLRIDLALSQGLRGLPGGSSLVKLLSKHRMPFYARKGIPLKRSEILDWAATHHELTGKRPTAGSGPVRDVPGETWAALDASLRTGSRGLRGTISLAEFLDEHYVPAFHRIGTRLTERRIIQWAVSFKQRVGRWPTAKSAYTDPSRTEKWSVIDIALREGLRGLPGGSSLAKLLRLHRLDRA